jgi:hypothetical protein
MKVLMLVSLKHNEKIFTQGEEYFVDNETACFFVRKRAAISINDRENISKKFHNKMLKINYEVEKL